MARGSIAFDLRCALPHYIRDCGLIPRRAAHRCRTMALAAMCRHSSQGAYMPTKIDPLNKKQYGAISAVLTVTDLKAAVDFYHNALGFTKRAIMNGPDGKPMHAELTLRDTTLMLGPENPGRGARSAKSIGGTPVPLYLLTED